jgi:hypothetical protein
MNISKRRDDRFAAARLADFREPLMSSIVVVLGVTP